MPSDEEIMQEFNSITADLGGLVLLRDHWDDTDAMADAIAKHDGIEFPYDHDPVAKRIAARMVGEHIKAWEVSGRNVYTRWCPDYDEARSDTVPSLYVLSYSGNPGCITALDDIERLKEVAEDMSGLWRCDTIVNRHCHLRADGMNAKYPVQLLAIKRGEYICMFVVCPACMDHISSGAGFNDDYIGPTEHWMDKRRAAPRPINRKRN